MLGTVLPASAPPGSIAGRHRARRVGLLLIATVLLSIGDLYATLTHLNSIGMVEVNPIAAHLMRTGSVAGLVLFKLGTLGLAVGLILHARYHRSAEVGAWILTLIMTLLMLHWQHYQTQLTAVSGLSYEKVPEILGAMASGGS